MISFTNITPATLNDYPTIQNMARFYVYDMSRYCGFLEGWEIPGDGLYECFDFKHYLTDSTNRAFLIKLNTELAGFVLLDRLAVLPQTKWNMGQFFILGKFQGKKVGQHVAEEIWRQHPGLWEVSVIPENKGALSFWRKTISHFTQGQYTESVLMKPSPHHPPEPRYIFSFDTSS